MDILNLLLLFGVGSIAGFINVNAGGGSSLTLPTLIFLGLEGALANGTNRVAIFIQNIFAVASFKKNEMHQFKESTELSLFTLPGAILGAILAVRVSSVLFERILGVVLILVVISMFFSRSYRKKNEDEKSQKITSIAESRVLHYGTETNDDLIISNIRRNSSGTNFKVRFRGNTVPIWLDGEWSRSEIHTVLLAIAIGLELELNLVQISRSLKNFEKEKKIR